MTLSPVRPSGPATATESSSRGDCSGAEPRTSPPLWPPRRRRLPCAVGTGAVTGLVLAVVGHGVVVRGLRSLQRAGHTVEEARLVVLLAVALAPLAEGVTFWALLVDEPLQSLLLSLVGGLAAGVLVRWRAPGVLRGRGLPGLRESTGP